MTPWALYPSPQGEGPLIKAPTIEDLVNAVPVAGIEDGQYSITHYGIRVNLAAVQGGRVVAFF